MNKVSVLVGIPMVDSVRAEFFRTFLSAINLMPEEGTIKLEYTKWGNTPNSRNDLVKSMLDGGHTHLFFMDSDMTFPSNTLSRLLQHDKEIVAGLYNRKIPPFATVIFKSDPSNKEWSTYNPTPEDKLIEVAAAGTGCMLIKREVFEKLEWPWFSYQPDPNGKQRFMSEDVVFCINAREKGIITYCDCTIKCGHVGNTIINPVMKEGELKVSVDVL